MAATAVLQRIQDASDWFWNDDFWLPPNVTWSHLRSSDNINYANFEDLAYPLLAAWIILAVRYLVEKRLMRALGVALGLRDSRRQMPATNDLLETEFRSSRKINHASIAALSKKLEMSERQIERWLRQRSLIGKASKLDKFCESGWKAFFYTSMYVYSWVILWDKKWFWDITDCWHRYPEHSLPTDVWYYYIIELSFYWSLLISQFFDVQRSDFWEMFAHHVATISLLSLSWTCNLFRIGTLVLWVHDSADVFLEAAKMFKYLGVEKMADLLFYCFALAWVICRLGYFPTWIIYSVTVEAAQFIQYFPAYHVFSLLLSTLLVLNLFWFYFIAKVAFLAAMAPDGKIEKDLRSESNSSD